MRFTVDEDLARDWVTAAVVAHEMSDVEPSTGDGLPPIGLVWHPAGFGEEDCVVQLVDSAQADRVLTAPPGMRLGFELVDDGDDIAYRFLLTIDTPTALTLASDATPMAALGDPAARGLAAALAVLHEAETTGNGLLTQLSAYLDASNNLG